MWPYNCDREDSLIYAKGSAFCDLILGLHRQTFIKMNIYFIFLLVIDFLDY